MMISRANLSNVEAGDCEQLFKGTKSGMDILSKFTTYHDTDGNTWI